MCKVKKILLDLKIKSKRWEKSQDSFIDIQSPCPLSFHSDLKDFWWWISMTLTSSKTTQTITVSKILEYSMSISENEQTVFRKHLFPTFPI